MGEEQVGRDNVGNAVDPQVGRDGVGNVADAQAPLAPQPPSLTENEPGWFKRYRLAQEVHNKKIIEMLEILASHLGVEICTPVQSPSAHNDEDGTHTQSSSSDEDGTHNPSDSGDEVDTHTPPSYNDEDGTDTLDEGDSTKKI